MTSTAGPEARRGQADRARDFCRTQKDGWVGGVSQNRGEPLCHHPAGLSSPEEEAGVWPSPAQPTGGHTSRCRG